jgi:hypothetical protein
VIAGVALVVLLAAITWSKRQPSVGAMASTAGSNQRT